MLVERGYVHKDSYHRAPSIVLFFKLFICLFFHIYLSYFHIIFLRTRAMPIARNKVIGHLSRHNAFASCILNEGIRPLHRAFDIYYSEE